MAKKIVKTTQRWVDALDKSIKEKWVPLSKGKLDKEPPCALCDKVRRACRGCPICKYAGPDGCGATPYAAWGAFLDEHWSQDQAKTKETVQSPEARALAAEELAFLRRVRKACVVTKGAK